MCWGNVPLSYNQEEALATCWPEWDRRSRPPQPDYFLALEMATDLGVDIFQLEGLEMRDPAMRELVKTWAYIRRLAQGHVNEFQAAAAELKSK